MTLRLVNKQGTPMGITHVTARIEGLDRKGQAYEGQFLVDTGAMDCLAPASVLVKAGIQQKGEDIYELANGEVVKYPYGFGWLSFMEFEIVGKIIFGPEGAEPILGVVAMETAGIVVDPSNQTLKRLAARSLKKVA